MWWPREKRGSYSFIPLIWYAASTDLRTNLSVLPASSVSYPFTSALASLENANKGVRLNDSVKAKHLEHGHMAGVQ